MFPRILVCLSIALLISYDVRAASISQSVSSNGLKYIEITGELVLGDEKTFKNIALTADEAAVFLNSPGGLMNVGTEIGSTIAIKGFSTAVEPNKLCASACGLIWLAGKKSWCSIPHN